MEQSVVASQSGPLVSLQVNGGQPIVRNSASTGSNMIIEISEPKKKKQVIAISDSGEQAQKEAKPPKPKERKHQNEPRKMKKFLNRCMLCKQPGKKSSMKTCLDCRSFFHQSCLEQEGESGIRYRCRKCRHMREESQTNPKKSQKAQKTNQQKLAGKRLQKEKKREEHQKKMGQFQDRYPYYFTQDKIRYPIEDKLLFIYRELFEIVESPKPKPIEHTIIPSNLLADLLQIENFFSTFKEELVGYGNLPTQLNKVAIFLSLESEGYDVVFSSLLECLIKIYLSDIFDKNKTDNVRILNDHPFFTLLIHLNDNAELTQYVIVRTTEQIWRYLATIPSMKKAFEGFVFPKELNLKGKVNALLALIQGMSEIDQFHELVSIKSQKMQQLTKEKTELVAQLKVDQAENLSNNQKLKDMNMMGVQMEQAQEGVTRQLTKELDKHKKKMQKLASQQTKTQETIKQIRSRIAEISRAMPFLTSQIQFLGLDRNNSQYFFYVREPNRLYVKFHNYLLDKNQSFYIYEGKQAITELLKNMNTKGLKEKHLYDNITSLIKQQIFNFNFQALSAQNIIIQQNRYIPIKFEDIIEMIKEVQQTFSVYLSVKQYQWAALPVRQLFMEQFVNITDLQVLKQQIRSLQENFLFAQYSNPEYLNKRQEESDQQLRIQTKEGRKKVPIRIWGINSQKTKKYWVQYLQQCIDVIGIWLCAHIFKINVDKYVKKKMDAYYEQQSKEFKNKPRIFRENRGRPPNKERLERLQKKPPSVKESSESVEEIDVQQSARRPNLRKRNGKKMNIVNHKPIQESEIQPDDQSFAEEDSSENEDVCQICGQYGDMICCDTCPKVYHQDCLKIKQVPEGQWSCVKCLQKLSNERQTRSRVKKMTKFM